MMGRGIVPGAAKEQERREAVPLMWWLNFNITRGDTPTEIDIPCRWISNSWVNLTSRSKKVMEAYRKQYDSAAAALQDEAAARQELHRIDRKSVV